MTFRVTYSTNVNEFYKGNGQDTTISLCIEADNFKEAEQKADYDLEFWVREKFTNFDIVSITHVDYSDPKEWID